jgi:SdpC family antimicrobial peptide
MTSSTAHHERKDESMERIGKYPRWLVILALAVAAAVGLTSLRSTPSYAGAPQLTPAQIADGVLFNEGPAAQYLTSVTRDQIPWTTQLRDVQSDIKAALESDASGYFRSQFVQQMQSGDPMAIRSALQRLGETTRQVLETRYGTDSVDKTLQAVCNSLISVGTNGCGGGGGGGTYVDVAEAVEVAVSGVAAFQVVIIVAVIVVIFLFAPPGDSANKANLAGEKLVYEIATGLRAAH